ncbi:hypothetical protein [Chryseobacterium arthrosphaerae]|uniref:hypothetical protein n=1 Tax=Chryseobacterium arthrosphaerae TaxID=651561 RepID=UPI0031DE881F
MENTEEKKREEYYKNLIKKNEALFHDKDSVKTTEFNDKGELTAFIWKFKIGDEEDSFYNIYTDKKTAKLREFCGKIVMISEVDSHTGKIPIYSV